MTKVKKTRELLHTDVIGSINPINHNRARFIMYNIDNTFKVHFKGCIKEKEKISRIFHVWIIYLENHIRHNIQYIYLNNSKKYAKLGA